MQRRSSRRRTYVARPRTEIRGQAIAAARELLLTYGPGGLTLTAVAEKIGRTHSALIHHFGSAEELQSALMSSMVDDLATALVDALGPREPGAERAKALVDAVFEAFDDGGAGVLAAWIVLWNEEQHLDPVRAAVSQLAQNVTAQLASDHPQAPRRVPSALLFLTLCAFADALIGDPLRAMLGLDAGASRDLATRLMPAFFVVAE